MAQEGDGASLGDIRRDLQMLRGEVMALDALGTTGRGTATAPLPGPILDRIEVIEAELRRLTRETEDLERHVRLVVADATARLDAMEAALDAMGAPAAVPATGAGAGSDPTAPRRPEARPTVQMATGEQAAFDAAQAALDAGDNAAAAARFADFAATYPGGPLTPRAHLGAGRALSAEGDRTGAARAFLDAFSAAPDGPAAAAALYELGVALDALGQRPEACRTFAEVPARFPESPESAEAEARSAALSCP